MRNHRQPAREVGVVLTVEDVVSEVANDFSG